MWNLCKKKVKEFKFSGPLIDYEIVTLYEGNSITVNSVCTIFVNEYGVIELWAPMTEGQLLERTNNFLAAKYRVKVK